MLISELPDHLPVRIEMNKEQVMNGRKKYGDLSLDRRFTALVTIDMEKEFCKPGSKIYHPDGVDEVIPQCRKLPERCRAAMCLSGSTAVPGSVRQLTLTVLRPSCTMKVK